MSKIETLHQDFMTIERLIQRANEAAWSGNGSQRKAAIAWKKRLMARRAAIVQAAGINA
jgi:hypothetical protein